MSESIAAIEAVTGNYGEDRLIQVRVQGNIFCVAQSRLVLRCPAFRTMLSINQSQEQSSSAYVELHNDVDEFKAFLWYIHADHLAVQKFMGTVGSEKKCEILLGIASVAHMYEALDMANWAVDAALSCLGTLVGGEYFSHRNPLSLDIATRLLRTAVRFQGPQDGSRRGTARDIVCDALHPARPGALSNDPILIVLMAKQPGINCTYVLAHAYFYAFAKGPEYWRDDPRLDASDRRRLLSGGFGLGARGYYDPKVQKQLPASGKQWPAVHPAITTIRAELWDIFDCTQWRIGD